MKMTRQLTLALVLSTLFASSALAFDDFKSGIENGFRKQNAIVTEHFRIEFSDLIEGQTDSDGDGIPDLIESLAEYAEESWEVLVEDLNYMEPHQHTERRVMIILDEKDQYLLPGSIGITSIFSNGDSYIALDPWLSDDYLKVTVAHEFFHVIQFAHTWEFANESQGINWAESTAVWVEEVVYDEVNGYVNYHQDFFDYVDYSIFATMVPSGTLFEYALNIWPIFLEEYTGDRDVIREIWEEYVDSSAGFDDRLKIVEAVEDIVGDLDETFRDFTLWNLDLDSYEEGDLYPEVMQLTGETGEYTLIDEYYAPALYGTNYLYFENEDSEDDFYFHVIMPEDTGFAVSLVPMDGSDADLSAVETTIFTSEESMDQEIYVQGISAYDAVVAVVSPLRTYDFYTTNNEDLFDEAYLYYYLAQYGAPISEDLEELEVDETGEKEGEEASHDEDRVEEGLTLSVINYDDSSITFSWLRPSDSDVDSYVIEYGTDSEDYDEEYEIDRASTTFAFIEGLEEGETYYFRLQALDDDADEVGDPSTEIVVTPEEWIFTDVSFFHDHYDAIAALKDWEIFEGYEDGSFGPLEDINRAELLKIFIEGRGITVDESQYNNCFTDVTDAWYAKYVCYAKEQAWVQGYPGGEFRPSQTVSKVEALKILFKVYEEDLEEGASVEALPYPDLSTNAWYSVYVDYAVELGLLEEAAGEDFNASDGRQREDMAEELYRYLVVTGS